MSDDLFESCCFKVCDICQELEKLDNLDVQAVRGNLKILSQKRITLNNSRNATHDRLSTKLPVEIICQIFILVDKANNHSSDSRPPVLSKVYFCAPAILSSVCRRWREIALSLQELWTNVYINMWREPDQVTKDWLHRSGALPLNLTLYVNKDGKLKPFPPEIICDILRTHSARWQYLNLNFAPKTALRVLFNDLEIMPESESFDLRIGDTYRHQTISLHRPLRPGRFHSKTTRLLELILCEWNNLTCLELSHYWIGDVLDIIRAAPKLKRCISRNMQDSPSKYAAPIEHKALEHLELTFRGTLNGSTFFRDITLPSLRHLDYTSHPYPDVGADQEFHDLKNFLVRSGLSSMSLQTFILDSDYPFSSPAYDQSAFLALEEVTHLSIDIWSCSNIIKPLLLRMSNLSVLPHLQDLQFILVEDIRPVFLETEAAPALSDFIAKHNSQLKLAKDRLKQGTSSHSAAEDVYPPQMNTPDVDLTNDGTLLFRPLRSISIQTSDKILYIAQMTAGTDPFLRESWSTT